MKKLKDDLIIGKGIVDLAGGEYVVLPCFDESGQHHWKIYSKDLKKFYGNYFSSLEVFRKLFALRKVEKEKMEKSKVCNA